MGCLGLDGELSRAAATAAAPSRSSMRRGAPVRRGTFGRGAREEIDADGIVDYAPFLVQWKGTSSGSAITPKRR